MKRLTYSLFLTMALLLLSCDYQDDIIDIIDGGDSKKVTICYYNPETSEWQTLKLKEGSKELQDYLDKGATEGDCNTKKTKISNNFEEYLIDEGIDDVLDGYVLTKSLSVIKTLDLEYYRYEEMEGLKNLEELYGNYGVIKGKFQDHPKLRKIEMTDYYVKNLDLSNLTGLEVVDIKCTMEHCAGDMDKVNASGLENLKEITIHNYITDIDLSNNPNLVSVSLQEFAPYAEVWPLIDLTKSTKLKNIDIPIYGRFDLDLRNGNNKNLESFYIGGPTACVKVDDVNWFRENIDTQNEYLRLTETDECEEIDE